MTYEITIWYAKSNGNEELEDKNIIKGKSIESTPNRIITIGSKDCNLTLAKKFVNDLGNKDLALIILEEGGCMTLRGLCSKCEDGGVYLTNMTRNVHSPVDLTKELKPYATDTDYFYFLTIDILKNDRKQKLTKF